MNRHAGIAFLGIFLALSPATADEEASCLSGKNLRFNRNGAASPGSAPSDVGMASLMETAQKTYGQKAQDAIMSQVGKPAPAPNPGFKDQFGHAVNPITLMPGYAIGFHQVVSVFGTDSAMHAILDAIMNDYAKRRIFGLIVSRYQLADDISTQYRLRAAHEIVSPEERNAYMAQIGRLLDANDIYLKQYFGLDTINPNTKAGTVRARDTLESIDSDLKDDRIKKAALDLYNALQSTDSYYKDLSLQEIECRTKALATDLAEADRIARARSDAAADRTARALIINGTRIYDAKVRDNPSPRPGSTDVIPGSKVPNTRGSQPGPDIGGVGTAVNGNSMRYDVIAPKYYPLQTKP
jgi:hypothetical protein